jgi:hypothetical protein
VNTALKGKRFRDAEDIKENVDGRAELNAVLLETVFKKFLNDSTHVLKMAEMSLNRNKNNF